MIFRIGILGEQLVRLLCNQILKIHYVFYGTCQCLLGFFALFHRAVTTKLIKLDLFGHDVRSLGAYSLVILAVLPISCCLPLTTSCTLPTTFYHDHFMLEPTERVRLILGQTRRRSFLPNHSAYKTFVCITELRFYGRLLTPSLEGTKWCFLQQSLLQ